MEPESLAVEIIITTVHEVCQINIDLPQKITYNITRN